MVDSEMPTAIRAIQPVSNVALGMAKLNVPAFAQNPTNLSIMISMNAKFAIDQGVESSTIASYVGQLGKYSPYKTIPDEKIQTEIEKIVKNKKNSGELADLFKSQGSKCTEQTTREYRLAYNAISGPDIFRFTKELINNEQSFKESHSGVPIKKYKSFIKATEKLLDNCYLPIEKSTFSKSHKLFDSIGSIYSESTPICTGLVFRKNNHVLTARHCFEFIKYIELQKNLRDSLWFKKAGEENEYQVCSILEKDALDRSKFEKAIDDQVVIRIAAPITDARNIELISRDAIKIPSADASLTNMPTSLIQISLFPFASLIRPDTFKSGFVQGTNPACIALSIEEGCFGHSCNAIPGGSGASIFLAESTDLSLVGTHIGDSQSKSDCKIPKQRQINVATYVKSALKQ